VGGGVHGCGGAESLCLGEGVGLLADGGVLDVGEVVQLRVHPKAILLFLFTINKDGSGFGSHQLNEGFGWNDSMIISINDKNRDHLLAIVLVMHGAQ
jgi:hypothetical protein